MLLDKLEKHGIRLKGIKGKPNSDLNIQKIL